MQDESHQLTQSLQNMGIHGDTVEKIEFENGRLFRLKYPGPFFSQHEEALKILLQSIAQDKQGGKCELFLCEGFVLNWKATLRQLRNHTAVLQHIDVLSFFDTSFCVQCFKDLEALYENCDQKFPSIDIGASSMMHTIFMENDELDVEEGRNKLLNQFAVKDDFIRKLCMSVEGVTQDLF